MRRTPTLHLLKAEHLPNGIKSLATQQTTRVSAALTILGQVREIRADEELLARVHAALAQLEGPATSVGYIAGENANVPADRYEEHDSFFGATRVAAGSSAVEAYVRTLLEAHRGHLHDVMAAGLDFADGQRRVLEFGFAASIDLARRFGKEVHPAPAVDVAPMRVDVAEVEPLIRWKLGHQVFFAMIQSLIVALNCVTDALDDNDEHLAASILDNASVVMCGSAAALCYAGDFSPWHYANMVRPAMTPPHLEPKFSGLQLRDHRYLLRLFPIVRRQLETHASRGGEIGQAYERFMAALRTAYDEHVHVCSRFGGDREPSLRMNAGATTPAAEVLERLKHARLHTMKWR